MPFESRNQGLHWRYGDLNVVFSVQQERDDGMAA